MCRGWAWLTKPKSEQIREYHCSSRSVATHCQGLRAQRRGAGRRVGGGDGGGAGGGGVHGSAKRGRRRRHKIRSRRVTDRMPEQQQTATMRQRQQRRLRRRRGGCCCGRSTLLAAIDCTHSERRESTFEYFEYQRVVLARRAFDGSRGGALAQAREHHACVEAEWLGRQRERPSVRRAVSWGGRRRRPLRRLHRRAQQM